MFRPAATRRPAPTPVCWVAAPTHAARPRARPASTTTAAASAEPPGQPAVPGDRAGHQVVEPAADLLVVGRADLAGGGEGEQHGGEHERETEVRRRPAGAAAEAADDVVDHGRALDRLGGRLGHQAEHQAEDGEPGDPADRHRTGEPDGEAELAPQQREARRRGVAARQRAGAEVASLGQGQRGDAPRTHEETGDEGEGPGRRAPTSGRSSSIQPERAEPSAASRARSRRRPPSGSGRRRRGRRRRARWPAGGWRASCPASGPDGEEQRRARRTAQVA